jgi:hypothetical protein
MADETTRLTLEILGKDRSGKQALKDVGDQADKSAKQVDHLSVAIEESEQHIGTLAKEIQKTGKLDLFPELRKSQSDLRKLQLVKKLLPNEEDGKRAGKRTMLGLAGELLRGAGSAGLKLSEGISKAIPGAIGQGLQSMPPQLQAGVVAALIGATVTASAFVGAAASGAIMAAVGGGTLAGGVALAFQDQRIQEAASSLGKDVMAALTDASSVFIGPVLKSIGILRTGFGQIMPGIKTAFSSVAPSVTSLTRGVVALVTNLMPGFNNVVARSAPILDMLGGKLGDVGRSMSSFFDSIASGSDGAKRGLSDLVTILDGLIVGTGATLGFLSKTYDKTIGSLSAAGNAIGDLFQGNFSKSWKDLDWQTKQNTASTDEYTVMQIRLADAMRATEEHARALADDLDKLAGAQQNGRQASSDFQAGLDELTKSVAANGTSLNDTSVEGRNNLRVVDSLISASERAGAAARDQALAQGKSADEANAAGARMREGFIADLQRAANKAGLSKKAINDMVAALVAADNKRISIFIDEIHRTRTSDSPSQTFHGLRSGGVVAAASGLVTGGGILRSPTILAGERATGGEVLMPRIPGQGGRARQRSLAAVAADWAGGMFVSGQGGAGGGASGAGGGFSGGPTRVELTFRFPDRPDLDWLFKAFRKEVRVTGGGDVQVAFGKN